MNRMRALCYLFGGLLVSPPAAHAGVCNAATLKGVYVADVEETDSPDADSAIARMTFNGTGGLNVEATGVEDRFGPPFILTVPGTGTYTVDSACRATFEFTYGIAPLTETMTGTLYLHQMDTANANNLAYGGFGIALSNGFPGKFEIRRAFGKF